MEQGSEMRFSELCKVCEHHFGDARQKGTSHRKYKTGLKDQPLITIQEWKGGKAKPYQVKQVLQAIAGK